MKCKKILSTILAAISFNFATGTLINRCNAMEFTDHNMFYANSLSYRCMKCGNISIPNLKISNFSERVMIYCKNCLNQEHFGKSSKFKVYNPRRIQRTKKFGVCPNSQDGKPHIGYINDARINADMGNMSRNELVNRTDFFGFHCYECNRNMIINNN